MHDHRFIFTSEHDAICEDVTCKYRYSKAEILRLLFEMANDDAAQQCVQADGAMCLDCKKRPAVFGSSFCNNCAR